MLLGGEQSGHLIWLDGHVTGDGLVAGLLLCRALHGRRLSEATAVMPRFPQALRNLPRKGRGPLPEGLVAEVERVNDELDGMGRVLVRPSGTEPVVRVLAEAETAEEAEGLCARIAALVTDELG
jgi:phosphoglucosamine mutase